MRRRGLSLFLTVVAGFCALGGLSQSGVLPSATDGSRAIVVSATTTPIVDAVGAPLVDSVRQFAHHVGNAPWLSQLFGLLLALALGAVLLVVAGRPAARVRLPLRSRAPPLS
ncbi:MAG: hypothetical protein JWM72_3441 [Actinomycetia bacterium]|jgi:hypothetical protein|nr:hypothetical protein [Actinomycetes bacterium]MDQ1461031.1 hypothetical protein [Actinomycetota bacterium]